VNERRSHGEEYPGDRGDAERQYDGDERLQQDAPGGAAGGNVTAEPGAGATGAREAEAPPKGGASPGAGVSGNEVDPTRPGPAPDTQDFDQLGALDAHVAVENPTFTDAPPAGYDPRMAPADSLRHRAVPEENLPGQDTERARGENVGGGRRPEDATTGA
jgi:hypothetical protein